MTTIVSTRSVEERLDRLSAQVEEIAAAIGRQQESRERLPAQAPALGDVADDVSVEDALVLARSMARSLPQLEALLAQVKSMTELGAEIGSLSGAGVTKLSDLLAEAERRGYFAVARGGASVADRVVAVYAGADFEALGNNLALLLEAAKELADPELIGLLHRTLVTLREGLSTHPDPPSTFGLLKQLREPQTRRGMARALAILQTIGAEPTVGTSTQLNRKG